jgi:hypothetical protein
MKMLERPATSTVAKSAPSSGTPASPRMSGLTTMMYAIVKKVVADDTGPIAGVASLPPIRGLFELVAAIPDFRVVGYLYDRLSPTRPRSPVLPRLPRRRPGSN